MTSTKNIDPLLHIYILPFPGIIYVAVTQGSAAARTAVRLFKISTSSSWQSQLMTGDTTRCVLDLTTLYPTHSVQHLPVGLMNMFWRWCGRERPWSIWRT